MTVEPVGDLPSRQRQRERPGHASQEPAAAADVAEGVQKIGGYGIGRWLFGNNQAEALVDRAPLFIFAGPLSFPFEAGNGFPTVSVSSS